MNRIENTNKQTRACLFPLMCMNIKINKKITHSEANRHKPEEGLITSTEHHRLTFHLISVQTQTAYRQPAQELRVCFPSLTPPLFFLIFF